MKRINKAVCVGLCLLLAASCSETEPQYNPFDPRNKDLIDPSIGLDREKYRDIYDQDGGKVPGAANMPGGPTAEMKLGNHLAAEPPIPDLAQILAAPKPPKLGETQLVSVAVTDDVPLKDVIIELARLANVDVEVDSGITGGIEFRAKDQPFNEVIDRIADMAGLRYTMKNNVLRVERDTPYLQTYPINFLNIERESNSSVNISTNVLSSATSATGGGGGGGLNSGSTTSITTKADSDFWKQFEASITKIVNYKVSQRTSNTTMAAQPGENDAEEGGAGAGDKKGASGSFYVLNKEGGTLTISGTEKQQEMIRQFLSKILASTSAQVLIEAKVVEVTLNDQFQSGIDWSQLGNSKVNFPFQFNGQVPGSTSTGPINSTNVATFSFSAHNLTGANIDLAAAVQLSELFGTTRVLSSPRLHAANNQQAVLTFAQNAVYFTLQVSQQNTTNTGGNTVSNVQVNSTVHTVPIGIIMTLQPSINMDTNEITLNVRPTLSKVITSVADPAVSFLLAQILQTDPGFDVTSLQSNIPVVQVRELDSILKLKSGQVMVIGGLMSDESDNSDQGVPGLSNVPWLGNLFKAVNKTHNVSELVIFIRATIVGDSTDADKADQTIYDKFTKDPRPLPF